MIQTDLLKAKLLLLLSTGLVDQWFVKLVQLACAFEPKYGPCHCFISLLDLLLFISHFSSSNTWSYTFHSHNTTLRVQKILKLSKTSHLFFVGFVKHSQHQFTCTGFLRQPRDHQQEVMPFAFLLKHVFH